MSLKNKKFAYTLSEVLLTIVLLGTLATMTLSTVGASVQQRARLAEFRTAYSKMNAALKTITLDEGKIYKCYLLPTDDEKEEFGLNIAEGTTASDDSGCRVLTDNFLRSMGATRICEGDAVALGCLPENYPTADGCFISYDNVGAYVLDNSMIILTDSAGSLKVAAIDVNGRKGPNKWGQDIFPFSVKVTESVLSHGNVSVTQLGIMPPSSDCTFDMGSAGKTTDRLMKESAGIIVKDKVEEETD